MHASAEEPAGPVHRSGAERLVATEGVNAAVREMLARAQSRSPDLIRITVECVSDGICAYVPCLPVRTVNTSDAREAAVVAVRVLAQAGVAPAIAHAGLCALTTGLGPLGASLRGAALWDRQTGARLDPNPDRGVRTSRFDYSDRGGAEIDVALALHGLTHFRTREALAVATKTLWAGVAAELCWSDERDYTTGYVATPGAGYVRLLNFKPHGARGGRIFYIDTFHTGVTDIEDCVRRLEREAVLIEPPVNVYPPVDAAESGI